jgi:hypothetical protein
VRNPLVSFVGALVHLVAGFISAGVSPLRFAVVRRPALASPPLEGAIVLAGRLPSFWRRPRRIWSTLAHLRRRAGEPPPCAAALRLAADRPPLLPLARIRGRPMAIRRLRSPQACRSN